jgi:hypothetical protein
MFQSRLQLSLQQPFTPKWEMELLLSFGQIVGSMDRALLIWHLGFWLLFQLGNVGSERCKRPFSTTLGFQMYKGVSLWECLLIISGCGTS